MSIMLFVPAVTSAQRTVDVLSVRPEMIGGSMCTFHSPLTGPVWDAILPPWSGDEQRFVSDLVRLRDSLRVETAVRPSDVDGLHELAAVLGTLTELQGASAKVKTAQELDGLTRRILEIEPRHAGAHHIIGRLHAAVRRLGRIERFVATRVLGGSALSAASWETARRHLEAAATGDPCSPQHHYELARLYVDTGEATRATETLKQVLQRPPVGRFEEHVHAAASALLDSLPPP
jgi:hypothetical protein